MISRRGFFSRLLGAAGAVAVAPHIDLVPQVSAALGQVCGKCGRIHRPFDENEYISAAAQALADDVDKRAAEFAFHQDAFSLSMRPLRVGDTIRVKKPQRFDVLYGHGVSVTKVKV